MPHEDSLPQRLRAPVGVGATEAARRVLTPAQLEQIVRDEVAEREAAALDNLRGAHGQLADLGFLLLLWRQEESKI